ncbi:MAG: DUF3109 family protein [Flavobacteriaceae bacterium]|nr:DUF3109 family protein [Flavobacteriaceae bacterium]
MFQIDKTILSEELLEKAFVCDLNACKGACCVEGEAGAPLDEEETAILKSIYPKVKPFLRPEGIAAIEKQGTHIKTAQGFLETPLVGGKECAYVVFDEKQTALCGIERAYRDGAIDWPKPISCHLYPVRLQQYSSFTAVNYHRWQICDDACKLGASLGVPVYKFVKDALIRKFGEGWYAKLEEVASNYRKA